MNIDNIEKVIKDELISILKEKDENNKKMILNLKLQIENRNEMIDNLNNLIKQL